MIWMPWMKWGIAGLVLVAAFGVGWREGSHATEVRMIKSAQQVADKAALDRIAALGKGIADLDAKLDARSTAQQEALQNVRRAIQRNPSPADGCRLDAPAAARLRDIFEAANAGRAGGLRDGAGADPASAGPGTRREAAVHPPE